MYFAVRMYPKRCGSLYFHPACPIMGDVGKEIMLSEKGGRQRNENEKFWKIADKA